MKLLHLSLEKSRQLAPEKLEDLVTCFDVLFSSKIRAEYDVSCLNINSAMKDANLSAWFALYAQLVFRICYKKAQIEVGEILDVVKNVHFNTLFSVALKQRLFVDEDAVELAKLIAEKREIQKKQRRVQLQTISYININALDAKRQEKARQEKKAEDLAALQVEAGRLDEAILQVEKPFEFVLTCFLLLEKIILVLEEHAKITPPITDKLDKLKTNIIGEPVRFIGMLAPILKVLQTLEQDQEEAISMKRMNTAIKGILQLFDFSHTEIVELQEVILIGFFEQGILRSFEDKQAEKAPEFTEGQYDSRDPTLSEMQGRTVPGIFDKKPERQVFKVPAIEPGKKVSESPVSAQSSTGPRIFAKKANRIVPDIAVRKQAGSTSSVEDTSVIQKRTSF